MQNQANRGESQEAALRARVNRICEEPLPCGPASQRAPLVRAGVNATDLPSRF